VKEKPRHEAALCMRMRKGFVVHGNQREQEERPEGEGEREFQADSPLSMEADTEFHLMTMRS